MSDYVFLNTTLRKVDRSRVTSVEVDALDAFFDEEYGRCCYNCRPYICHNEDQIFGSVEVKSDWFKPENVSEFAKKYPDVQIEIIVCYSDSDAKDERHLFQGGEWEQLNEVRYFPEPKKIKWTGFPIT